MRVIIGLFALLVAACAASPLALNNPPHVNSFKACASSTITFKNGEKVTRPRAHESLSVADLPSEHFWGNISGVNYLTQSRNQHIPQYCGSCWAVGTASSLSDRIKIARKAQGPDVILAVQVILNCGEAGCGGGDPGVVFDYMEQNGLPEETCQNYEAVDGDCKPNSVCEDCSYDQSGKSVCTAVTNFSKWNLDSYGLVNGGSDRDASGALVGSADKMKAELFQNGPIACGIHATNELLAYTGGIFSQFIPWSFMSNHIISVVGWGVDSAGLEYWIGRNSWGTYWGESGFFRINMHHDNLGINDMCSWATPNPTPTYTAAGDRRDAPLASSKTTPASSIPVSTLAARMRPAIKRSSTPIPFVVTTPMPHTYVSNVPRSWDVRDVAGGSFSTVNLNQHNPKYCGSCWTHSTVSALGDRIKMARNASFPDINLSPQMPIYCAKADNSSGCEGGDPSAVYLLAYSTGMVDETCTNYEAIDGDCTPFNVCRNCRHSDDKCFPVDKYPVYKVSQYGQVTGAAQMQAEISTRGPISCVICVTEAFANYSGGVFSDATGCVKQDHAVEIAGYGTDNDGTDFWLMRNSWGTYWGENGWARIKRGVNTLGVETNPCDWAVPA